jgi:hypothetical protein
MSTAPHNQRMQHRWTTRLPGIAMTAFASRLRAEPALITWGRRILGLLTVLFLLDATVSGYRAWVQIFRLNLQMADTVLSPGSSVQVSVKTSGRTFVQVRLELLQSGRTEVLAVEDIPKNGDASLDPRAQYRTLIVQLPPALWSRFRSGPALLRATAIGRPQWLRTPPPTVRERSITLR